MATATQGERVVIDFQSCWAELNLPPNVREVLSAAPLIQMPETRQQLMDWALGRSTGETDWTLGNRDDHGQYEAVKPSSPRRAMGWPSIFRSRPCGGAIPMRW
jgi:hypothetical protein